MILTLASALGQDFLNRLQKKWGIHLNKWGISFGGFLFDELFKEDFLSSEYCLQRSVAQLTASRFDFCWNLIEAGIARHFDSD